MNNDRSCERCGYATKEGDRLYCARWNGPTYNQTDWCYQFIPKEDETMKSETMTTDLSGAPEEIKAQILANDAKLNGEEPAKRTRLVYICSRYKDDPERNVQLAQEYCREAMEKWPDVLPLAPHVYFTQFLDDSIERERALGLAAGISLLDMCDEIWVYGIENPSAGMTAEIEYAKNHAIPVVDAAELYRTGRSPEQAQKFGDVKIEVPKGARGIDGVLVEDTTTITVEGELVLGLAKDLRRYPGEDLIVQPYE